MPRHVSLADAHRSKNSPRASPVVWGDMRRPARTEGAGGGPQSRPGRRARLPGAGACGAESCVLGVLGVLEPPLPRRRPKRA